MQKLTNKELIMVEGGFAICGLLGIVGGLAFLVGIIDGFVRPLKCNK